MTKALKHKSNKKKRLKFQKKGKKDFKPLNKRGRLVIRNLPFSCTESLLRKHFAPYGEIIDINLLRRPNGKLIGCGFVEYTTRLNADKAREALHGHDFFGRPIYIERAVARDRFGNVLKDAGQEKETVNNEDETTNEDHVKDVSDINEKSVEDTIKEEIEDESNNSDIEETFASSDVKFSPVKVKEEVESSGEESNNSESSDVDDDEDDDESEEEKEDNLSNKKRKRNNKNLRKARLIIRNLSFKSTEEKLKEHFEKYGEVVDVQLLRKDDNKLIGCGFVQFTAKQSAAKAIHHTSGKPFLDRPIIVDWAVPKNKFLTLNKEDEVEIKTEIKEEPNDKLEVKREAEGDVKDESLSEEASDVDIKSESDSSDEEEEEDSSADEDESKLNNNVDVDEPAKKKPRFESNDVSEGKTVFLKNVPFSVTNEELKKCMLQFGPVYYALVCVDKLTEHSKGTAFVKFKEQESAEKCLSAGTELTIKGVVLDPHPALMRNEATKNKEKLGPKDSRNLYLIKEGVILAGTPAAKDVSQQDMQKRLQLEQWKTQMLRNLNMFVSRGRLIVHNLPEHYDDEKLRSLFKKYAGPTARIREARVMRDLKNVDSKGVGISKGHGFVSFTEHDDALKALRAVNNNPHIFTKAKRPIVAFSIENKAVLNAKTKRALKSKQNNPLYKNYVPPTEVKEEKNVKTPQRKQNFDANADNKVPKFVGIAAKPGSKKLRTKFNLKTEAATHLKEMKKDKRNKTLSRRLKNRTRGMPSRRQNQDQKVFAPKQKIDRDDVNFNNICNTYKKKLNKEPSRKKKWYQK